MGGDANIVFYDGECGFCNRAVKYILKNDKSKSLFFASIQSEYSERLFQEKNWEPLKLNTFYLLEDGMLFEKSKAALKVTRYFAFPQRLLTVFRIIPICLRDQVYDFIAIRRHHFSKGYCVVLNEEEKSRFM